MRRLLPPGPDVDRTGLPEAYAYPPDLDRPWVRVNFVCSLDGAVSVDGVSGGLGTPADKAVFGVLRRLADVILVGSGPPAPSATGAPASPPWARTPRRRWPS